jgi:hypothetical protein
MSVQRDPDAILATWLEAGPVRLPDATKRAIAVTTRTTRQTRRPMVVPWRIRPMTGAARIALGAVAVVAIALGGLYFLGPTRQGGVGGPPAVSPSPAPTAVPSPTTSASAADPLVGTWGTGPSTCAQQNAALTRAGYTAAQLALSGWDAATCRSAAYGSHGSVQTVQFQPGGAIVQRADGVVGWQGTYEIVDATTMRAHDQGWTITYHYTIDGDSLVIDMLDESAPNGTSEADIWADRVAQTVIYESLPFTKQD